MRKKLEEDLKIITLRMGNVIQSINLAHPQFFGVAAFIVVRAGRAPGKVNESQDEHHQG